MQNQSDTQAVKDRKHVRFANDPSSARTSSPPISPPAVAQTNIGLPTSSAKTLPARKISRAADFFRLPPAQPQDSSRSVSSIPTQPPTVPTRIFSQPILLPPPFPVSDGIVSLSPDFPPTPSFGNHPRRAADFFKSPTHAPRKHANPPRKAFEFFKPNQPVSANPNVSQPPHLTPGSSTSCPIIRLPVRRKNAPPADTSNVDSTPHPTSAKFVFNTDDHLATRQTQRSWQGTQRTAEWILSREDLHAHQVDRDRELPVEMDDPWYPSFAISPADLNSLHRYLSARYDIPSFDEYTHLLALFRNTRAIEAHNARQRYTELSDASASMEEVHLSLIRKVQNRHRK